MFSTSQINGKVKTAQLGCFLRSPSIILGFSGIEIIGSCIITGKGGGGEVEG